MFSLGPQLSATLFQTHDAITSAIGVVVLASFASAAQLRFGRIAPWIAASAGSIALAAGTMLIVAALALGSPVVFLVGSAIGGVGFGLAFLGGLRALVAVIPNTHRAGVMSAFYLVAYASLSVPAVIAGVVVRRLGLELTFELLGSIASLVALLLAVEAWRTRPRTSAPA
jgi:hypothetical protein